MKVGISFTAVSTINLHQKSQSTSSGFGPRRRASTTKLYGSNYVTLIHWENPGRLLYYYYFKTLEAECMVRWKFFGTGIYHGGISDYGRSYIFLSKERKTVTFTRLIED